jgi:hypothetical protein
MSDTELLVKIASDVGALKQLGETQSSQITELFEKVNALCEARAEKKGEEKGTADVWARIGVGINLLIATISAYFYSRMH